MTAQCTDRSVGIDCSFPVLFDFAECSVQKAVPCKALYKSHKDFIARERPEGHSEGLER